jgi:hypothetical protein
MRWFTFEEDKLARFENQYPVYRVYPGCYARLEVSSKSASTTGLILDLVVWISQEFRVSTFQAGEEASPCGKKGGSAA